MPQHEASVDPQQHSCCAWSIVGLASTEARTKEGAADVYTRLAAKQAVSSIRKTGATPVMAPSLTRSAAAGKSAADPNAAGIGHRSVSGETETDHRAWSNKGVER